MLTAIRNWVIRTMMKAKGETGIVKTLPKKEIVEIWNSGKRIHHNSLKLIWDFKKENTELIKLIISVPKKKVKLAVKRNYIKRVIREIFRREKPDLLKEIEKPISIIIVYNKNEVLKFKKIEEILTYLFQKLIKKS